MQQLEAAGVRVDDPAVVDARYRVFGTALQRPGFNALAVNPPAWAGPQSPKPDWSERTAVGRTIEQLLEVADISVNTPAFREALTDLLGAALGMCSADLRPLREPRDVSL